MTRGRPPKTPDARSVCVRLPANLLEHIQATARERAFKERINISTNDLIKDAVVAHFGGSMTHAGEVKSGASAVTQ